MIEVTDTKQCTSSTDTSLPSTSTCVPATAIFQQSECVVCGSEIIECGGDTRLVTVTTGLSSLLAASDRRNSYWETDIIPP